MEPLNQSAMTAATKRKHVVKEMLEDFSTPGDDQMIVKVLGTPGSNLHEVITPDSDKFLCSLPTKFRKNIWIKRGDFVVVESITEGDKVKAEIVRILYPQHVKDLQKEGCWPEEFLPERSRGKYPAGKDIETVTSKVADLELSKQPASYEKEGYVIGIEKETDDIPSEEEYYSSEDDLSDIPANTNRPTVVYEEDSTSDSEDEFSSGV